MMNEETKTEDEKLKAASELNEETLRLLVELEVINLKIKGFKDYVANDARTYYEEDRDYSKIKNKLYMLYKKRSEYHNLLSNARDRIGEIIEKELKA